jgi:hypothetical protein
MMWDRFRKWAHRRFRMDYVICFDYELGQKIEQMRVKGEHTSRTDVIATAMVLYDFILTQQAQGKKLCVESPEGFISYINKRNPHGR